MEKIDYWRLCDHLSVIQAALLVAGADPTGNQDYIDGWEAERRPDFYDAALAGLQNAIRAKILNATLCYRTDDSERVFLKEADLNKWETMQTPDWHGTTVAVEDLKKWLIGRGFKTGFFFPDAAETDEFLDQKNPYFAPKLAAAVNAWKAVTANEILLNGKTPKQALIKWLRENAKQFGLSSEEDGSPNEQGIEEIAKVANWSPQGGAAKTPTVVNLNPPTQKKDSKNNKVNEEDDDRAVPF